MEKTPFKAPETKNGWVLILNMNISGRVGDVFQKGGLRAIVSHEDHVGRMRWHMSISRAHRYPSWEEIKDARYSLLPHEFTFAQILPPPSEWVNVHPNTFHLWEIDTAEW